MAKLFTGGFGFLLCLLIGILLNQVALGILAGMFLGGFLASRKTKAPENGANAASDGERG